MASEEAFDTFRQRRWAELRKMSLGRRDAHSRLLVAWAAVELGEPLPVDDVRAALRGATDWALHDMWGLWPFRKRVGVDVLVAHGLHAALLARCWAAFDAPPYDLGFRTAFARDWVSPELAAFNSGLGSGASRPPWQLGSAKPVLEPRQSQQVVAWALDQLASSLDTPPEAKAAIPLVERPDELRGLPYTDHAAFEVIADVAQRATLHVTLGHLGEALSTEPDDVKARRSRALDQLLLRLDLEARLKGPHRAIAQVLFRQTPKRALDVVVARLEGGLYGTLARYVEKGMPDEVWTEGTLDEALAAVPEAHFAEAVTALRG